MQRWSTNIFKLGGIQLSVHASFLILPVWVGYESWSSEGWSGVAWGLGLLAAFFSCVVLHEFGHALVALRLGIRVPRIILLPIGGMAQFERIPRRPIEEVLIAVAGPLVNVFIALLLYLAVTIPSDQVNDPAWEGANGFLFILMTANVAMAAFNMIPVFPMDGGRVLRALLAVRLPYVKASFIAATVAKILGTCGIAFALWQELWLLAVLFGFIILVGEAEYRQVKRSIEAEERMYAWLSRLTEERLGEPSTHPDPEEDSPRP